jgi:thiosulfate reductase cytochrome b subunit
MPGPADPKTRIAKHVVLRHSAWVRATHWLWVACLAGLLMSGLQIFNAHPALYFGKASDFDHPWLSIGANADGSKGLTNVLGHSVETTGWLGLSSTSEGLTPRAFPHWITVPGDQDLGTGRRWHFLFAWILVINGFVYLAYAVASGHLARDLWPRLREFRKIPQSIWDHVRLRFGHGEEARHYNILQKLTYALVLFGVLPVLVLAGMTMSPALNATFPWLLDLFGGRQSARSVHFIMATLLVLFVVVHVVLVLVSGFWNNMRGMITGRYVIKEKAP